MKYCRILFFLLLFVIVLQRAPLAAAFEVRNGNSVNLTHDQTINGSMLATGSNVTIDGVVRGDVYCAGKQITISGLVDGDVLCAGQSIVISGVVTGNVRLVGQTIDIQGTVRQNASILAQMMTLQQQGSINGEMLLAGQTFILNGLVGKGVSVAGQAIELNGKVNGDMWSESQSVLVGDKAVIGGNLKYTSPSQIQIPKTASISGTVTFTQAQTKKSNTPSFAPWMRAQRPASVGILLSIIWNVIVVSAIVFFFPKKVLRVIERMKDRPVKTGCVGFAALIILPMIGVFVALTIIGIPFAILWFILYAIVVGISRSFAAIIVGDYIVDSFFPRFKTRRFLPVFIGVTVLWLIFRTPFTGGLISFCAVCWGMGGMVRAAAKSHQK